MNAYFRRHSTQKIVVVLVGLALLYAIPFFTIPGNAAAYIKIEGIEGESRASGYEGWIDVESVQFKVERQVERLEDGSRSVSKPVISDIVLAKEVDKATPKLFTEAVIGTGGTSAEIHVARPTAEGEQVYMKFRLSDILVSSLSTAGGDRLTENVTLNFPKVEMEYTPYSAEGKPEEPISSSYDVKQ